MTAVETVQLFVTCLVDGFFPQVGRAVVTVLERAGCRVEFPLNQTCCGQPALNAGHHDLAAAIARHATGVLDATEGPIVVPSGSCADMLVRHLPDLLAGDPAAARVSGRVRELTQFLVDDLGITSVGGVWAGTAVYHRSCHGLRGLGLAGQGETLLDGVAGLTRCDLDGVEECCGFGGLFSIEMPEVSAAMMAAKLEAVAESGAELVVGGDVSCLMHLAGGMRRRGMALPVRHVAEVLAGER